MGTRETAKQRNAREEREEQARIAQLTLEYPQAMMLALAQASSEGMSITVSNVNDTILMFVVNFEDGETYDGVAYFGLNYTYGNQMMLDKLKYEFERRQFVREALAKQKALVVSARAKLSSEELEALGL